MDASEQQQQQVAPEATLDLPAELQHKAVEPVASLQQPPQDQQASGEEQIQQQTPEQREEASKMCCLTGFKTTGTPTGKETTIAGLKTYIATPSSGDHQGKCVVLLSDVFGYVRIKFCTIHNY